MGWMALRAVASVRLPAYITAAIAVLLILTTAHQCGQKLGAREAAKRAVAARELAEANLQSCQVNTAALQGSVAAQNAKVEAMGAESAAKVEAAEKALAKAQRSRKEAEKIALELAQPQPGANVCEKVQNVDKAVLRSLR